MSSATWFTNLGVMAAATLLSLAAAEGAVRVIAPIYPSVLRSDPELLHTTVPSARRRSAIVDAFA